VEEKGRKEEEGFQVMWCWKQKHKESEKKKKKRERTEKGEKGKEKQISPRRIQDSLEQKD
jgi:hypothetical protein